MSRWPAASADRSPDASRGRRPPTRLAVVAAALLLLAGAAWSGIPVLGRARDAASPFAGPPAACRVGDVLTPHRSPDEWQRTLLDQEYTLAPSDAPPDLVRLADLDLPGNGWIRSIVVDDLRAMAEAAERAGSPFRIISAYRSYAHQERTFASLESAYGRDEALRSAARPGHSEHQLGTTIDVRGGVAFLADHAHRFGFVVSYPPEHSPSTTCYKPEPWHLRYLGRDAAAQVKASGESLRVWLWRRQLDEAGLVAPVDGAETSISGIARGATVGLAQAPSSNRTQSLPQ